MYWEHLQIVDEKVRICIVTLINQPDKAADIFFFLHE